MRTSVKAITLFFLLTLGLLLIPRPTAASPDTITEILKLTASDASESDQYGFATAVDGDTLVIGSIGEDGGPGNPVNGAGAVYVYQRDEGGPNNWGEVAILRADDLQEQDAFGAAVAIHGDTIVVGAPFEDGGDGDPFPWGGAAYIFERNAGGPDNWGQTARLSSSDPQEIDNFGRNVAIHNDTIVVGAQNEDGGPGDPLLDTGAAYVFERNEGGPDNWGEVKKLQPAGAQAYDHFGAAVDVHADTIAVGNMITRTGGLADDAGMVVVFERDLGGADNWGESAVIQSDDAQEGDDFGRSVAISGDTLLAGAPEENGGPGDPLQDAGAAYVFERNLGGPGSWGQAAKITSADLQEFDFFGRNVALDGDRAVIGATGEDGGPGDPIEFAGAAYVFERNLGGLNNWGQVDKLTASDTQANDWFSVGTALDGNLILIGTHFESGGPGNPLLFAGAAYLFEIEEMVLDIQIFLPVVLKE